MSHPFAPQPKPGEAPWKRLSESTWAGLGLAALLASVSPAKAFEVTTRAKVSLDFPHGQVTVSKTWDSGDDAERHIVIREDKEDYCPPEKEVVAVPYREPEDCDPPVVYVRQEPRVVYLPPRYEGRYAHRRHGHRVILERSESRHVTYENHSGEHSGGEGNRHEERHGDGPSFSGGGDNKPLFTPPSPRPSRERGAQR